MNDPKETRLVALSTVGGESERKKITFAAKRLPCTWSIQVDKTMVLLDGSLGPWRTPALCGINCKVARPVGRVLLRLGLAQRDFWELGDSCVVRVFCTLLDPLSF